MEVLDASMTRTRANVRQDPGGVAVARSYGGRGYCGSNRPGDRQHKG